MAREGLSKIIYSISTATNRRYTVFTCDLILTLLAGFCVYLIDTSILIRTPPTSLQIFHASLFILTVQGSSYWLFGLYRGVWRFASMPDLIRIIKASTTGSVLLSLCNIALNTKYMLPHSFLPLFCLFTIVLLGGSRLSYRWFKDYRKPIKSGKKVLIIGAGFAGENLLRKFNRNNKQAYFPVGFIDDDLHKHGLEIHGVRVLGNTSQLVEIAKQKQIELILIALPKANAIQMRKVVDACEQTGVSYRTLPNFNDIASGRASVTNIRQVSVEDLLSRDPIQFERQQLQQYITAKKILITGAGGSIGSELCRKIAEYSPAYLVLIDHAEFNLFQIQSELQQRFPKLILHCFLLSIANSEAINRIMQQYQPEYVFHAAAYKHVPMLESQVRIAIENNIFGTEIMAEASIKHKVKKFVLVSTDKAVNPTNVMGATKRCAELVCQCLNQYGTTKFITVRFGNVLGSTGSVVPIFRQQIEAGGPVTITHPDIERYFMTIPEASQLIMQTLAIENESPDNLFVLDMGTPVKIQYLAEQMIRLSGHKPNEDINITYCGLRPGEKLYEELFYAHETMTPTSQEKIWSIATTQLDSSAYLNDFAKLRRAYYLSLDEDHLKTMVFHLAGVNSEDTKPEVAPIPPRIEDSLEIA